MIAGLFLFLILSVMIDFKTYRIPNALTAAGTAAGLIYHLYRAGLPGMLEAVKDLITGIVILFPLYRIKCLGAGDIKLLSVISVFLGWKQGLITSVYSLFAGAVLGLVKKSILFARRRKNSTVVEEGSKKRKEVFLTSSADSQFVDAEKDNSRKMVIDKLSKKGGNAYKQRKDPSKIKNKIRNNRFYKIQIRMKENNADDQKCVIHYSLAIWIAFLVTQMG